MRRRAQILVFLLFLGSLLAVNAMGQQRRTYPPFTSVTRLTEYDAKGGVVHVSTSIRYESSTGDWRVVSRTGGDEYATLYRRGKGVYQSNSRTYRIIKQSDHAPGCPLRTAQQLRNDPKFNRTEEVLGLTAYVWIDRPTDDLQIEPQSLRLAAVEAAYNASFKPVIADERPILAKGIIDYQFVLPK